MSRSLNEIYRTFISNQYPVIIANLKIPTDTYDVNVSPDKRTIFIHNESKIAEAILDQLKEQLEPSRSTFQVNSLMSVSSVTKPISAANTDDSSGSDTTSVASSSGLNSISSTSATSNRVERIYNPSTSSNGSSERSFTATRLSNATGLSRGLGPSRGSSSSATRSKDLSSFISTASSNSSSSNSTSSLKRPASTTSSLLDYIMKKPKIEETDESVNEDERLESETMEVDVTENNVQDDNDETDEMPVDTDTENEEQESLYVGIKSIGGFWNTEGRLRKISSDISNILQLLKKTTVDEIPSSSTSIEPTLLKDASIQNTVDNEIATEALSRVIHKPDFARMKVLGQFNLGFIIASLDDKDLYIIDQHASDEKYNFETLQQTTRIETQKLLR